MINFADFMDNMDTEEVQLPAGPSFDNSTDRVEGSSSMVQSSFVNSSNLVNVHTIRSSSGEDRSRAETINIDKKV